jgi:hypothetical protein
MQQFTLQNQRPDEVYFGGALDHRNRRTSQLSGINLAGEEEWENEQGICLVEHLLAFL